MVVLNLYSYVDSVMLGYCAATRKPACYAAAYKVYEGLSYAPARHFDRADTQTVRVRSPTDQRAHVRMALRGVSGTAALGVVVAGVAYAVATPLLVFLFGAEYGAATSPFRVLSLGLPVVYAIWILHAIAISVDRERLLLEPGSSASS